ncbi:MAG: 50S ribosomal protein L29 [Mycoplasmatales bacterium]
MKMSEIKDMDKKDIESKVQELKKELLDLRFQIATGNLEDTAKIAKLKKDVARLKTVLNTK